MNELENKLIAILGKWWLWLIYIFLGVVAKFSYDLSMRKKINFWQAMGSTGLSVVAGIVVAHFCMSNGYDKYGYLLVIFVTLLSDKIATFVITNWKDILAYLLRIPPDKK